jgi:uncharacterized membrane protein YdjX (TVP38/TMEM64 family)
MRLGKYKSDIGFTILVLLIAALFCAPGRYPVNLELIQEKLVGWPLAYSGAVFVLLYVIVTFFIWFSKDAFWLMSAVIFGPYVSAVLILLAEFINAGVLFSLSRNLGRGFLEKNLSGRYKRLDEKIRGINFFWLLLFRAAPLIPYRFLDIAAGLTGISFRRYFYAVLMGSPLKIFWIQNILYGVGKNVYNPRALGEYMLGNKLLLSLSILYIFLIPLVIFKLGERK